MQDNPAEWVMPNGNYSSTRYSTLSQINRDNVGNLTPAWTFSTGVLRGHEGGPLVIGDVMYIVTPFPNIVYALDLNDDGRVIWKYEPKQDPSVIAAMCCDTVNRGAVYGDGKIVFAQADSTLVALDAATGQVVWQVKNADPGKGEVSTAAPLIYKDKVYIGVSGGEWGVHGFLAAYNLSDGKQVWRGFSTGPDDMTLMDGEKTTHLGKPVGKDSGTATWEGEQWKMGGGIDLGLVLRRSRAEPDLLRHRQSGHLEPGPAPRRQSLVDDHLRPRCRHRHRQVGLPDDAPRRVGL